MAYIPAAPQDGPGGEDGLEAEDADGGEAEPVPPEALVEECEVPVAAGEAGDSDAASDTSAEALPQCAILDS